MAEAAVSWRLEGTNAYLQCGPFTGHVDVEAIGHGLDQACWENRPLNAEVFCLYTPNDSGDTPRKLPDVYVRGKDLVATFERIGNSTTAPQVYWRIHHHLDVSAVGIELILSMHTDLLDSQPQSCVMSVVGDAEVLRAPNLDAMSFRPPAPAGYKRLPFNSSDINLILCRRRLSPQVSYAEIVHPDDFCKLEIGGGDHSVTLESTLFPERLEKGVIRRARICGWFLPAENDLEVAVELARRFVNEPPPLTT